MNDDFEVTFSMNFNFVESAEKALQEKMKKDFLRKDTFEEIFAEPIDTRWADHIKEGIKNGKINGK